MTQLLQNLIGNAIKFQSERQLHIHIGTKRIEHAWQFDVNDNASASNRNILNTSFSSFNACIPTANIPAQTLALAMRENYRTAWWADLARVAT